MDAYEKGLTGSQAAWASWKNRGHRTLPDTILAELDKANIILYTLHIVSKICGHPPQQNQKF